MTFSFRPAVRERVGLLVALAGASGSGKTFSALQLAKGLANGHGKIAMIDTEAGRAKHYADQFDFLHGDMTPPFTPERYIEAIESAQTAGASVVVIDSMSHEWAGDGGLQDIHSELAQKLATDRDTGQVNPGRLEAMSAPAWREPKMRHKRMVSRLLQSRAHLIFCLRAEDKVKFRTVEEQGKNGRVYKKTVIEPAGWMPICEKHFMYEMTLSFTLAPDTPGIPRFDLPHKCQDQHRAYFPEAKHIGAEAGRLLGKWAAGSGEQAAPTASGEGDMEWLQRFAGEAAALGEDQLKKWWGTLSKADKLKIQPLMEGYKAQAKAVDTEPLEDPFADVPPSAEAAE